MGLVRVVYVDVLFLLLVMVDWVWLWAAGRLAGVRTRPWRIGLAAGVGAAADIWALFPSGFWLRSGLVRLAGTLGLLMVGYAGGVPARAWVRLLVCFLGTGAAMGGTALLLAGGGERGLALVPAGHGRWVGYAGPAVGADPLVLAGLALALAGGNVLIGVARAWRRFRAGLVAVEIRVGGGQVRLIGLVDTGNQLREPLSGAPVLVADGEMVAALLPPGVREAAHGGWAAPLPPGWAGRCRCVPYQAVGATGWLPALRPDAVRVGERAVTAWVALAPGPVDPSGCFQALVPAALLAGQACEGDRAESRSAGGDQR